MAFLRVMVAGGEKASIVLNDLAEKGSYKIATGLRRGLIIVERAIKKALSGPGRSLSKNQEGVLRRKGGDAAVFSHLSRAGANQFPGTKSGELRRSVTSNVGFATSVSAKEEIIHGAVGAYKRYAAIHEFGGPIRQIVTQKQRMFLGMNLGIWKRVGSTLLIPIPARPYVSTMWDKESNRVVDEIRRAVMA